MVFQMNVLSATLCNINNKQPNITCKMKVNNNNVTALIGKYPVLYSVLDLYCYK